MFGGVESSGTCMHGVSCFSIMEAESYGDVEEKRKGRFKNCDQTSSYSSSSTSSIGKNSDLSGVSLDDCDEEEEVQSSFKRSLDMQELEHVLPIRKGISRFYNGKSKSFASLADASSCKELTKPETTYSKRGRNLLAYTLSWDKTTRSNSNLRSNDGIAKRVPSATRSSLALAVAMKSLHSELEVASRSPPQSSCSRVHPRVRELQADCSPPPRGKFSSSRSFSLADLQECASVTTISATLNTEIGPH